MSISKLKNRIKELDIGQVHIYTKIDKETDKEVEGIIQGSSHANSKYYKHMVLCLAQKEARKARIEAREKEAKAKKLKEERDK